MEWWHGRTVCEYQRLNRRSRWSVQVILYQGKVYLSHGSERARLVPTYHSLIQRVRLRVKLPDMVIPLNPGAPPLPLCCLITPSSTFCLLHCIFRHHLLNLHTVAGEISFFPSFFLLPSSLFLLSFFFLLPSSILIHSFLLLQVMLQLKCRATSYPSACLSLGN